MFEKLKAIFSALQAGKSLKNPTAWKKVQATTSTITGLLVSLLVLWPGLGITPEQIHLIALAIADIGGWAVGDVPLSKEGLQEVISGIGTLVFVVLVPYWTVATTEKIGLPTNTEVSENSGGTGVTSPLDGQKH